MGRPRSPYQHLELNGLTTKNKNHYEMLHYNPTEGIPLEGIPVCPRGTTKRGKKFWNTTIPYLCQIGVLSYTDLAQMEALLFSYEALQKSIDDLRQWDSIEHTLDRDNILARKNLVTTYNISQTNFNTLASKFGMTPSDRTKLPIISYKEEKEEDPLSMLGL